MKVGLIDVDGTLPNLALMKLSAWHKAQGDEVEFALPIAGDVYGKLYASAIFTRSRARCEELKARYGERIDIGGTGFNDVFFLGYIPEVNISFILPLVCFVVVAWYGYQTIGE